MMKGIIAQHLLAIAGLVAAIFIIVVVVYPTLAGVASTECWKATLKPFEDNLGGSLSSNLQPSLGNKNAFNIDFFIRKDCISGAWFIDKNKAPDLTCAKACSSFGGSSSIVEGCQKNCYSKCGSDKGDCIVLVPAKVGSEAPWYNIWQNVRYFYIANKPVVFSSGKNYAFDFGGLEKIEVEWNLVRDNRLSVTKSGKTDIVSIPSDGEQDCLLFKKSGSDAYSVEFKRGECGKA